jgi:hypothetical protein
VAFAFVSSGHAQSIGSPGPSTYSAAHDIGTCDFLSVRPGWGTTTAGRSVTDVKWAGGTISHAASASVEKADGVGDSVGTDAGWYKTSPTTGSQTLAITMSGTVRALFVGWDSWTVGGTAVAGTPATNSGTTANGSVTLTSAAGEICLASLATISGSAADHSFASTDERWEEDEQTHIGCGANGASKAGAASVTMTAVNGTGAWAIAGIPFQPPAGSDTLFAQACL